MTTMSVRFLVAAAGLFATLDACAGEAVQPAPKVVRLDERRIPFPDPPDVPPGLRVERPYFDAANRLQWDDDTIAERPLSPCPTAAAPSARPAPPRRSLLARPRVDERRCPETRARRPWRKLLVGFDAQGRQSWERPLVYRSGEIELEQWLIGATPEALVLSSLEVWSPATGETLVPARVHDAAGRPVPDVNFTGSALYLAKTREVLLFEAEVTLLKREGGLYRIALDTGRKELWLPIEATLLGTYDRVEAMALSRDGRLALLGLRQRVRGATPVSVAVYDLTTRERVFEERMGFDHVCSEPQVVAGDDGQFAFAYRDDNAREHVLVRYRVQP